MSLLKLIADYDQSQQEYITYLEEKVSSLKAKIGEMIDQGMRDAAASQEALLKNILSGAIDKPREHKVWIVFREIEVGGSDIAGVFHSAEGAKTFAENEDCGMSGPFEIK